VTDGQWGGSVARHIGGSPIRCGHPGCNDTLTFVRGESVHGKGWMSEQTRREVGNDGGEHVHEPRRVDL